MEEDSNQIIDVRLMQNMFSKKSSSDALFDSPEKFEKFTFDQQKKELQQMPAANERTASPDAEKMQDL